MKLWVCLVLVCNGRPPDRLQLRRFSGKSKFSSVTLTPQVLSCLAIKWKDVDAIGLIASRHLCNTVVCFMYIYIEP